MKKISPLHSPARKLSSEPELPSLEEESTQKEDSPSTKKKTVVKYYKFSPTLVKKVELVSSLADSTTSLASDPSTSAAHQDKTMDKTSEIKELEVQVSKTEVRLCHTIK